MVRAKVFWLKKPFLVDSGLGFGHFYSKMVQQMMKNLEKFKQSSASEIVWPGADQKLARNFHEPTLPDISNNLFPLHRQSLAD